MEQLVKFEAKGRGMAVAQATGEIVVTPEELAEALRRLQEAQKQTKVESAP